MKPETLALARTLYRLAHRSDYSEEQAAARIAIILDQVEDAAVSALTAPLCDLGRNLSVAVALQNGPAGWTCAMTGPYGAIESRPRTDALAAVGEALDLYEAKRPACSWVQVPA